MQRQALSLLPTNAYGGQPADLANMMPLPMLQAPNGLVYCTPQASTHLALQPIATNYQPYLVPLVPNAGLPMPGPFGFPEDYPFLANPPMMNKQGGNPPYLLVNAPQFAGVGGIQNFPTAYAAGFPPQSFDAFAPQQSPYPFSELPQLVPAPIPESPVPPAFDGEASLPSATINSSTSTLAYSGGVDRSIDSTGSNPPTLPPGAGPEALDEMQRRSNSRAHVATSNAQTAPQQRRQKPSTKKQQPKPQPMDRNTDEASDDSDAEFQDGPTAGLDQQAVNDPANLEKKALKFDSFLKKLEKWQETNAATPEGTVLPITLIRDGFSTLDMLVANQLIEKVEEVTFTQVISLLHIQIRAAKSLEFGSTLSEMTEESLASARSGLVAGLLLLRIVTAPGVPKAALVEEPLESTLDLIKLIESRIFRTNDTDHSTVDTSIQGEGEDGEDEESLSEAPAPVKKPRKNAKAQTHHIVLTPESQEFLPWVREALQLMHALATSPCKFPDEIIIAIVQAAMDAFFAAVTVELQFAAMAVLRAVFAKYQTFRSMVIEDLVQSFVKMPKEKKATRKFKLEGKISIQMSTALILQLCQSAVELQSQAGIDFSDKKTAQAAGGFGFNTANAAASNFVTALLSKCIKTTEAKKDEKDKDSDPRLLVENFVEDLLACTHHPEWPLATWAVSIVLKLVVDKLEKKASPAMPVETHIFLLQLISPIMLKLRKEMKLAKLDTLFVPPAILTDAETDDPNAACPTCTQPCENRPMICCDTCRRWFHGECVNIFNVAAQGKKSWFCDPCLITKQINEFKSKAQNSSTSSSSTTKSTSTQRRKSEDDSDSMDVDEDTETHSMPDEEKYREDVARQMILNYLADFAKSDEAFQSARHYLLAQWTHFDADGSNYELFKAQWHLDLASTDHIAQPKLSCLGTSQLLSHLHMRRRQADWALVFKTVVADMSDKETRVRAKAAKALGAVVEIYPKLLADPSVSECLHSRFKDPAVSVREASLDLFGKYIMTNSELATKYYKQISSLIDDTGKSVRKRAVKILQQICLHQSKSAIVPELCKILSTKLRDENNDVKTEALKTFQALWFSDALDEAGDANSSTDLEAQQNHLLLSATAFPASTRVEQILHVLSTVPPGAGSQEHVFSWLSELISTLLKKDKVNGHMTRTCKDMCQCLIEMLIKAEEAKNSQAKGDAKAKIEKRKESCLLAMLLIGRASSALIEPHIGTLVPIVEQAVDAAVRSAAPNLSAEQKAAAQSEKQSEKALLYIISMMELVIPSILSPDEAWVTSIATNIKKLVSLGGEFTMQAGIRCVALIASKTGLCTQLTTQWYDSWMQFLQTAVKQKELPAKPIRVSLFCLGHLLRFFAFDAPVKLERNVDAARKQQFGEKAEAALAICSQLWNRLPVQTKKEPSDTPATIVREGVISALANIATRLPSVFFRYEAIFKAAADKLVDKAIKLRALQGLLDFLQDEASKLTLLSEKQATTSTKADAAGRENADSGITSAVVQSMLVHVSGAAMSNEEQLRSVALEVLGTVLTRKMTHPLSCLPYVVAMTSDLTNSLALRASGILEQQDLDIIRQRCFENVKQCYKFQVTVFNRLRPIVQSTNESGEPTRTSALTNWYSVMRDKAGNDRHTIQNFLSGILKHFEYEEETYAVEEILFLRFLFMVTISLPFKYEEEVLYAIYRINNILLLRADNLKAQLKQTAKAGTSHDSKFLRAAFAQGLLMGMKRFFKKHYILNDSKCQNFQPDMAVKHQQVAVDITTVNFSSDFTQDWLLPVGLATIDSKTSPEVVKKLLADYMQEEKQLNVEDAGERKEPAKRGRKRKNPDAPDTKAPKKKAPKKKRRKIEDSYDSEGEDEAVYTSDGDYE